MNPQEFSWTEDQQVTVVNPTDQPYSFKVHSKEYVLGPQKIAKMPGYIAWVYVYGMSTQLAQADGKFASWNEEGFRQQYYQKLVKNVDAIVQDIQEEPEPAINTFDEEDDHATLPTDTPSAAEVANTLAADEDEQESKGPVEVKKTPVPDYAQVKPMQAKASKAN